MLDDTMDATDADMTEAETSQPSPELTGNIDHGGDDVRGLLMLARHLIEQGKPSQALRSVVMAMRTKGGNEAVFQTLNCARELYRNKLQASAAADQLASLFIECAIAEAIPSKSELCQPNTEGPFIQTYVNDAASILSETGRQQIVQDAFGDGSSFVCVHCGGLVSTHRKEEHFAYWCCQI